MCVYVCVCICVSVCEILEMLWWSCCVTFYFDLCSSLVTHHALLSFSFVCVASLGTVLTSAGAGFVSVSWHSDFASAGPFLQRMGKIALRPLSAVSPTPTSARPAGGAPVAAQWLPTAAALLESPGSSKNHWCCGHTPEILIQLVWTWWIFKVPTWF